MTPRSCATCAQVVSPMAANERERLAVEGYVVCAFLSTRYAKTRADFDAPYRFLRAPVSNFGGLSCAIRGDPKHQDAYIELPARFIDEPEIAVNRPSSRPSFATQLSLLGAF